MLYLFRLVRSQCPQKFSTDICFLNNRCIIKPSNSLEDKYKTIPEEDLKSEPFVGTPEELNERSFDLNKLFAISQVRESPHPQFDGMSYIKYNETNEMADISYIAPKKNKFDTRVTSGITHEKDSSIVSLLQGFNFETNVTVFCKDKEMPELSTSLTAWIKKAKELDHYDEKRPTNYRNIITQGTSFASVKHVQEWVPNKVITSDDNSYYTSKEGISFELVGQKKKFEGPTVQLEDGKKVFMEDFHQGEIRKQVGTYIVNYTPRDRVKSIWGNHPRWKYVPKRCNPGVGSVGAMITQGSIYSDWWYMQVDFDKMEIIEAIRPYENRYQIYINGVPMLPAGFPLTVVSPCGDTFLTKGDIDPMNMCAYSKGIPAKTKMDQALYDSFLRCTKIAFEQSIFPPSGNNSGRVLSPDIFMPSKITRNLRKEDISILTDNAGLQPAHFSYMTLLQTQIDNKSVSSLLEGGQQNGDMTLGQYLDSQKRQLIKLGGIFDGIINWEKQISHLMLMDLLYHADMIQDNIPIKDTLEDGSKGTRVLRFKTDNYGTSDDLHQEENDYKFGNPDKGIPASGEDVRYCDMNPDDLKAMVNNPDYYFYYEVVPVDKNNDKVTQGMFISMVTQAAQLFGMQSMAVQKLKRKYAQVMGQQFDDIFLTEDQEQTQAKQLAAQQNPEDPNAPGGGGPVAPGIALPGGGNKQIQKMYT